MGYKDRKWGDLHMYSPEFKGINGSVKFRMVKVIGVMREGGRLITKTDGSLLFIEPEELEAFMNFINECREVRDRAG